MSHSHNSTQPLHLFLLTESLCGDDFKSDVWFLLDGSASIDEKEFDAVQNFTATMASKFDVSSKNVQLGLSVFAHNYKVVYDLKEETDLNAFESATNMASQPPCKLICILFKLL